MRAGWEAEFTYEIACASCAASATTRCRLPHHRHPGRVQKWMDDEEQLKTEGEDSGWN